MQALIKANIGPSKPAPRQLRQRGRSGGTQPQAAPIQGTELHPDHSDHVSYNVCRTLDHLADAVAHRKPLALLVRSRRGLFLSTLLRCEADRLGGLLGERIAGPVRHRRHDHLAGRSLRRVMDRRGEQDRPPLTVPALFDSVYVCELQKAKSTASASKSTAKSHLMVISWLMMHLWPSRCCLVAVG